MVALLAPYGAPSYDLTVDGLLPSVVLRDRLISLSVTYRGGLESDQLSLTFDDRPSPTGGSMRIPPRGKAITVWMGYQFRLVKMGTFEVTQVSLSGSGGGRTLSVSGVPRLLLDESTRTWANTTLADIVTTIADENGLSPRVSRGLGSTEIAVENQVRESDLSFLTRLAEKYDAVAKPAGESLLFLEKGEALTASGRPVGPVVLGPLDISSWSYQTSEQTEYAAVVALWHDLEHGLQREVRSRGSPRSDGVYRMAHLFISEAEAQAAADAKFKELTRDTGTLSLTAIGNPELTAEGRISVQGLRDGVDGEWIPASVTHTYSSGGYQCSLSAYRPS
ncbi:MAG TPA: hypothetical protein DDY14_14535 [Chromatiaceae bacterium]|jgi:phage protein D|nr:MAG: hypothetical protein N838_07935 [Thiohalocapsa sp. PB-PSB1]QQO52624.1 MAG: hypothetical protein N838_03805 [Thiohalocapsa sp. PB-PSB1]HBG96498.1 hypothetical protein [Chromatiaceae bacterium]HCS90229.1 hypothetical protein [Chromatiaceae bacterium]